MKENREQSRAAKKHCNRGDAFNGIVPEDFTRILKGDESTYIELYVP